jgi:hypothetical protein
MTDNGAPLDVLARFRERRPSPGEKCELCGVNIGDDHSHVVKVESRSLLCTCRPCYLLFLPGGASRGRYKAVPDRYLSLSSALSKAQWDALQIPVNVAFFFFNSGIDQVVAFYPGPAGATESLLSLDEWDQLRESNPVLSTLEPDVEAVLVRAGPSGREREAGDEPECYIVPIDACYELVGRLRMLWKGFDGGKEANQALDEFFAGVQGRARIAS